MTILISNFINTALSVNEGFIIYNEIVKIYNRNLSEEIVLDFNGINLFSILFFNTIIEHLSKEQKNLMEKVKFINLSSLGKRLYKHSVKNAKVIFDEETSKIICKLIDES